MILRLALATAFLLAVAAPARAQSPAIDLRPAASRSLGAKPLALDAAAPTRQITVFGLPKNMGPWDRAIRGVLAAGLAGVGVYRLASDSPNKTLSWVLTGVSVVPAATAATGYCPLYQVFGIDYSF